jgi:hypothetical protein
VIVCAALCWWHERPEDLHRCVSALSGIADRIVALDGSYRRYPGATVRSPEAECDAIREAAAGAGMGCLILQPDRLWAGQVEKRSHLLAAACADGTDWIVNVDADHVVHGDREAARRWLDGTSADVVAVRFLTPVNEALPPSGRSPGLWHEDQGRNVYAIPHFYRSLPEMRVERKHWWYSAVKGGERVWVWGGEGVPGRETLPVVEIPVDYHVEHLCQFRTPEQVLASRAFLNDRERVVDMTGQEDDLPGLPEPVWDYERMPV